MTRAEDHRPAAPDWRAEFHLQAFLTLSLSDRDIERRELVWIKRYFSHRGKPQMIPRLEQAVDEGRPDGEHLAQLARRATDELTTGEKRRFVYNLAQLCKSKGRMNDPEYEKILDLAERIGVADTEADAIINSVYSVNDSFMAIVGLLALGCILYFTQVVIIPLVISLFITMIVNKVEGLVARRLKLQRLRWVNQVLALVLMLSVVFGLVMAASDSAQQVAQRMPVYEQRIRAALADSELTGRITSFISGGQLQQQLSQLPIASTVKGFVGSLFNLAGNVLLVMIFTGFLVFSGTSFRGILQEMNEKISGYITIKTLIGLLSGVLVFAVCAAFGIDFALFWAILALLLNYIPSVGSIVASVPPVLLAVVQLDSAALVALFAALLVLIHITMGQVLEPKLMGDRLAVKPVAILLGLIFWGFLWGIPGMFLAAPLMALLRILASYFNFSRSFERLLAAEES